MTEQEPVDQDVVVTVQSRERSTVKFPYSDLESAIKVARTIKDRAGISCEIEQLAAWMGQSSTSGTFRSRYSAARLFGFISTNRKTVLLTELGQDVLNPSRVNKAKATAFLNIELFKKIYATHKGQLLPPTEALKRMIGSLGVTSKQEDRARQTFLKSAETANFIDPTTGVFIEPGFPSEGEGGGKEQNESPSVELAPEVPDQEDTMGTLPIGLDPIILGLISRMPKTGAVWPVEERNLWLELLKGSFKLVYKEDELPDNPDNSGNVPETPGINT